MKRYAGVANPECQVTAWTIDLDYSLCWEVTRRKTPDRGWAMKELGDSPLLNKVYKPNGVCLYFGFFGGGPATDKQKNYLRVLLRKHAGDPTAEAIRNYMNEIREEPGAYITVSDVSPAIKYLKTL